jgi:hypothetical protein
MRPLCWANWSVSVPSWTDAAFTAWLATLPALGYDRDWIRRNGPALRQRWIQTAGAPLERAPQPTVKPRDRYEEL